MIAGVNAIAAETDEDAQRQFLETKRRRVALFVRDGRPLTDAEADRFIASPQGRQLAQMTHYSAVGDPGAVRDYLDDFARTADADELIVAHQSSTVEGRLRSVELLAEASDLEATPVG